MQVHLYITFQMQAIKVNKYIGTTFQKYDEKNKK